MLPVLLTLQVNCGLKLLHYINCGTQYCASLPSEHYEEPLEGNLGAHNLCSVDL